MRSKDQGQTRCVATLASLPIECPIPFRSPEGPRRPLPSNPLTSNLYAGARWGRCPTPRTDVLQVRGCPGRPRYYGHGPQLTATWPVRTRRQCRRETRPSPRSTPVQPRAAARGFTSCERSTHSIKRSAIGTSTSSTIEWVVFAPARLPCSVRSPAPHGSAPSAFARASL